MRVIYLALLVLYLGEGLGLLLGKGLVVTGNLVKLGLHLLNLSLRVVEVGLGLCEVRGCIGSRHRGRQGSHGSGSHHELERLSAREVVELQNNPLVHLICSWSTHAPRRHV